MVCRCRWGKRPVTCFVLINGLLGQEPVYRVFWHNNRPTRNMWKECIALLCQEPFTVCLGLKISQQDFFFFKECIILLNRFFTFNPEITLLRSLCSLLGWCCFVQFSNVFFVCLFRYHVVKGFLFAIEDRSFVRKR